VKSQDETLEEWCRSLLQAYDLEDVQIDVNAILSLAGVAAHSVVRPAAPLTTFIAGLAAGLAAGSGQAPDTAAMAAAMDRARILAADYDSEATASEATASEATASEATASAATAPEATAAKATGAPVE
jgi:hypothetical protein